MKCASHCVFHSIRFKFNNSPLLWKGLFIAHHNTVPDKKRMEIYNALSMTADGEEPEYDENGEIVDALMSAVAAEYEDAIKSLKRGQGNAAWKRT